MSYRMAVVMQLNPPEHVFEITRPDDMTEKELMMCVWTDFDFEMPKLHKMVNEEYYCHKLRRAPLLLVACGQEIQGYCVLKSLKDKLVIRIRLVNRIQKICLITEDLVLVIYDNHSPSRNVVNCAFSILSIS